MALDLRQNLKLSQQLLMTPQLQQAIKLLQLSRLELEQFVTQQLVENPVLEEGMLESAEENVQTEREKEKTSEQALGDHVNEQVGKIVDQVDGSDKNDVDWESMSRLKESAQLPSSSPVNREEAPNYENMLSKGETLADFLHRQLREVELSSTEELIATQLIGNIDTKGYLQITLEELCDSHDFDLELTEGVLDTIQRLEPSGIGARDLAECLLIQLRNDQLKNGIVEKIITDFMKELEIRNYGAISKKLEISIEQVVENVAIIAELDPIPARQFGGDTAQVVVPDVYVFKLGDQWVVSLNDEGLPKVRINDMYQEMLAKQLKGDDKEYLKEKVKSAEWLIKSIQQRQKTIYKVAECILERQQEFFDKGVQFLRPMVLKDVAADVEMSESTISRVTRSKYMHTPQGIFELKFFFNSSVSKTDGKDLASESVKSMIKQLISAEDLKKPLSDQKIVDILEAKQIQLARRTVAKYREQMNILPSSKRKRLY